MNGAFVAGVDGCKAGWVCVWLYEQGDMAADMVNITEMLRSRPNGLRVLAIDMPIGLIDGTSACDKAARAKLGWPRRNSVFSPPCRAALAGRDYAEGCQINESLTCKKTTRQS